VVDPTARCFAMALRPPAKQGNVTSARQPGRGTPRSKQVGRFCARSRMDAAPEGDSGGRSIYLIVDGALERMSVCQAVRGQEVHTNSPGRENERIVHLQ